MEFKIEVKNYRCFSDNSPARFLLRPGFTALLGPNNSGKSSLIKLFHELRNVFNGLGIVINNMNSTMPAHINAGYPTSITDTSQLFYNGNDRGISLILKPHITGNLPAHFPAELVLTSDRRNPTNWRVDIQTNDRLQRFPLGGLIRRDDWLFNKNEPMVFTPILLEAMRNLANFIYIGPFRNAINTGTKADYYDITVGQSFIQAWRQMKTGNSARQNEAAYRLSQDIAHIFGYNSLEINPSPDDTTLQIFLDGRSFKLQELGAGLTQFILVLVNAAMKKPTYIVIDEPELNLHPSLQLDFLTTLGSYAEKGVIFATHSIGLARSSADQIYSLRQNREGFSEIRPLESTPRLAEFVGELSYSGYRELGFKKILLVEGVNEVKTVQQFLRMIKKDHQVVILSLGGSQLINATREEELMEVTRISPNVFALIDSEKRAKDDKLDDARQGFLDSCKNVGIECHILERRAFENYFTDNAVKGFLGDKYRALQPYERLAGDPANGWAKSSNWQIARRMGFEDIQDTDLGIFLAKL